MPASNISATSSPLPDPARPLFDRSPKWSGFSVGMSMLALLGVGGQVPGLQALLGFADERAQWDARQEYRRELTKELDRLQFAIQAARVEADGITPVLQERQAELEALRGALSEAELSREEAFAQRAAAQARAATATATTAESESALKALVERSNALKGEISALQGTREQLQGEVAELTSEAGALEQKRLLKDRAQERLAEIEGQILSKQSRLESIGGQLATRSADLARAEASGANQVSLQAEVDRLEREAKQRNEEVSGLQTRVADLDSRKTKLLEDRRKLEQEVVDLADQARGLQVQVGNLEAAKGTATAELSALEGRRSEDAGLAARITAQEARLARLKDEQVRRDADLVELQSRLNQARAEEATAAAVADQLATVRTELGAARAELEKKRTERDLLTGEVQALRGEAQALRQQAEEVVASRGTQLVELARAIEDALKALKGSQPVTKGGE